MPMTIMTSYDFQVIMCTHYYPKWQVIMADNDNEIGDKSFLINNRLDQQKLWWLCYRCIDANLLDGSTN